MRQEACAWAGVILATLGAACGGGTSEPSSGRATVRFVYRAPTATRTDVPGNLLACVRFSAPTHAHIGWRNFELVNMTAVGADRWELTQTDVPIGPRNIVLISDPNACFTQPDGFALQNVLANDVPLTTIVQDLSGPGFSFAVAADGRVTP